MGDGMGAPERTRKRRRMVMQLEMVRGGSFLPAADTDAACAVMDTGVWGKLPEELLWEVVHFVPAAKLFQLHLVSRKWREVLTSAQFRKKLAAAAAAAGPRESEEEQKRVLACVWPMPRRASARSPSSDVKKVSEVDLSMVVPSWFWSQGLGWYRYAVVAAAHGLVCISNGCELQQYSLLRLRSVAEPEEARKPCANRYCVVNPLTRTCVVLPALPFQAAGWLLPTSTAVTIWGASDTAAWRLATYDLVSAAGDWVSAPKPLPSLRHGPSSMGEQHIGALLGGKTYWYTSKLHVMGADGVQVGALDGPSVTLLGLDEASHTYLQPVLMVNRGAVYLVAQLVGMMPPLGVVCGVWRLAHAADGRMDWEGVARGGSARG